MLIHWHCMTDDPKNFHCSAQQEIMRGFINAGLIEDFNPADYEKPEEFTKTLQLTEKGEAHVRALVTLPLPVARWVTPQRSERKV